MNENKSFYVGLDIGTNSVGIACTDQDYNLRRSNGKDCWAVRLFDTANTAAERRVFRTARRRLQRRKYRLGQLQALFAPYIADDKFFIRLNNSQFLVEDKDERLLSDKNTLFADDKYTDKDFHKRFPTIYHLRLALQNGHASDIRLYYLALHHIVKYRGHFLFEGSVGDIRDIKKLFVDLNTACEAVYADEVPYFDTQLCEQAKNTLMKPSGIRDKQKALEALFGGTSKAKSEIIKAMCGGKLAPKTMFEGRYEEEKSFSLSEMQDEAFDALAEVFGDDFVLLQALRNLCNFVKFEKLFAGQPNISSAMIAVYDKHAADLAMLKIFLKTYAPQMYNKVFRSVTESANYVNYIGYNKKKSAKTKVAPCKYEDFLAFVKKIVAAVDCADTELRDKILTEIDNKTFLPKILHADNGLIPHQVNEDELVKIVKSMTEAFPETQAMAKQILPLFRFRIPYYVGPLVGENSWAVRKSDERITPWNFNEVIDLAASNEQFMRRMTNKCTYLHGEDVLPKCSIVYQKFNTLNQINKLQVDGRAISVELKKKIFDQLFLAKSKVSDKMIVDLLVREGVVSPQERANVVLSGKDGEIKASMSSYIQLKRILGDFVDEDLASDGGVCENIILWHTLNTDKSIVEDLIRRNYGDNPHITPYIKQLKGLMFADFGRLSDKLLTGLRTVDKFTGELRSILDLLYDTNQNFNEIIFDERYDFAELIRKENSGESTEITYEEDIATMRVSPALKRGIWQSLQLVDEYVAALGGSPDKIFIEVTREDGVKGNDGRTVSRKKQLLEKYKGVENIDELVAELQSDDVSDMRLRQEKLYLYFRQLGKCMYTGKRIDLSQLNTDLYDVDHILPRTYIKDDSLDNKVLVLRSKNAEKSDAYPLPQGFSNQAPFWKLLLDKGLIGEKTYKRLTRTAPLTDDDYNDFINRQKTITDQTAKAVVELLKRKYPQAKVVFSKAKNVSDFKQRFDLHKCRETNDLHHARDAYLNIVVGNVYDACFTTPMAQFRKDGDVWRTYNLKTMFTRNVKGAWDENSLATVKKTYSKCSMSVTEYTYCGKGAFYNQTVYGAGDTSVTAPRKANGPLANTARYGGYKSQNTAYFAIVDSLGKKGVTQRTIEAIPVMVAYRATTDTNAVYDYLTNTLQLRDVKVVVPKVKKKQLVSYNGSLVRLTGITGNSVTASNACQLFTNNKIDEYVNQLLKLLEMDKNGRVDKTASEYVMKTNRMGDIKLVVDKAHNEKLYDCFVEKLQSGKYGNLSSFVTFGKNLQNGQEKFANLTTLEQAYFIVQILRFFKCDAQTADIKLVGGSAASGRIYLNGNITDVDFQLIDQSPCGLTVRTRKL